MSRFPAVGGGDSEQPIASKDRAETFQESDVSITQQGTLIKDGSIKQPVEATHSRPADTSQSTYSYKVGAMINPNVDLEGVKARLSNNTSSQMSTAYLIDSSKNILTSTSIDVSGEFTLLEPLTSGENYAVAVDDNGSDVVSGFNSGPGFPQTNALFDWLGYYQDGDFYEDDYVRAVNDITGIVGNSATAHIEWPEPEDVYRWDAATYQTSPDGETVEVFVEESSDGGSTWTEIAGPISRGDQIGADPGSQVRFRVELSRADTANAPTLDAIYRRWVV